MPNLPAHQSSGIPAELAENVVSRALAISAIAAPSVSGFVFLQALTIEAVNNRTLAMCFYGLLYPVLWLVGRKWDYRITGSILLGSMMLLTFVIQLWSGLYTSQAPLQLIILILAGLIFGSRGVYITLTLNLLVFGLAALLVLNGVVVVGEALLFDPYATGVWIRSAIIMTLFGGVSAWAVVFTVSKLQEETAKLRETLAREREHNKALGKAELEKEEALLAVAEAQRIEVLGRLASGVAHDFNNSLTVIMTSTEMAQRAPDLPPNVGKYLDSIKRASIHAADMTKSLLALGRKDPSRLSLVAMADVINNMSDSVKRLLPEDITFSIAESTNAKIYIDRTQLERAILNMVINAKDAVGSQGEISIGCRQVNLMREMRGITEGPYVQLWVKDNGHGMSKEVMKHIFEPFFTTKTAGHGTGMGMALIHSFASEANGKVEVDSAPGAGTKIYIYIPEATSETEALRNLKKSTTIATPDEKYTILVVEDNPEVLAATTDTLRQAGFDVLQAINGNEAIDIINNESQHFNLMCIDGVIPGPSSGDVIQHLQSKKSDVKIVVCSGYVEQELILRGIRTGDLAYVRKPYLIDELLDCINTQLAVVEK